MIIGLIIIFLLVLLMPLSIRTVENNLELFLFVMGLLAATLSKVWSVKLFLKASIDPINITLAVFLAGLFFKFFHHPLKRTILRISNVMPFRLFIFLTVVLLGLISSVITAIVAALVLVLIVTILRLDRKSEVRFVVLACFSIGLGAALTPIGEPLSTIAISKMNQDFFYLMSLIGPEVIFALLIYGFIAAFLVRHPKVNTGKFIKEKSEGFEEILLRALKIYFFVMGLTFLGEAFEPLINLYFIDLSPKLLYWLNMISAVLDNATLASAEISPAMKDLTVKSILLGLLISGGMLIPGNIPNIIAAGKLKITSKEWAQFGLPVGFITMLLYYFILK